MEVDPVIRSCFAVGELRRLDFPNNDGSAVDETLKGRSGNVCRREKVVVRAITAASAQPLHVEEIFDRPACSRERLLSRLREIEPGRHRSADSGCTRDMRGELLEAAVTVGNSTVEERLLLVVVERPRCRVDQSHDWPQGKSP